MNNTIFTMFVALVFFASSAQATLVDNGNYLIYDTDLDITWYDNPNYVTHVYADYLPWVEGLSIEGASDWRLPTTPGLNSGYTYEGELGHLFHYELNDFNDLGPFKNLTHEYLGFYTSTWQGNNVFYYDLRSGSQSLAWPGYWYFNIHAIAVHDGNIGAGNGQEPVPEPATMLLFGTGLAGLAGAVRRKKKE